jgi:hypothetical protein
VVTTGRPGMTLPSGLQNAWMNAAVQICCSFRSRMSRSLSQVNCVIFITHRLGPRFVCPMVAEGEATDSDMRLNDRIFGSVCLNSRPELYSNCLVVVVTEWGWGGRGVRM